MRRFLSRTAAATIVAAALAGCAGTPTMESTGEWIDDTWITTKVKSTLLGEGAGMEISVETFRGQVQLSGFAKSQADIDKALQLTRGISGVKGIKNDIRLRAAQK
jgi:osmotically-inducible protein OsmY